MSQVKHEAPWFLRSLVELLSALTAQHAAVRVFFIHGWNVVQPVCDVGIGLRQRAGKLIRAGKESRRWVYPSFPMSCSPFVPAARNSRSMSRLDDAMPRAAKNNFMQVFRRALPARRLCADTNAGRADRAGKINRRAVGTWRGPALARTGARALCPRLLPYLG